jgi:galactokinase
MTTMRPLGSPDRRVWAEPPLLDAFGESFASPATLMVSAPGRINLIGEHTDYNDGFVLPMAIDRSIWIALRPRSDGQVVVRSLDFGEERRFDLDALRREKDGWIEYVKGTAWSLLEAGLPLRGWEGVLAGEIPMGAGLSSSAAVEIAVARAFIAVSKLPWDPLSAARWAQRAENEWVGVQCGIMDQLIVAGAQEGHALLIDCRDLRATPRPLPAGTVVVTLDTSTRRDLADSAYNQTRARCAEAARMLGLGSLRELSLPDLEREGTRLPESLRRAARHVVSENARTLAAAKAMDDGDAARLGELMSESHRSLRDDLAVSSTALDAIVLAATEAGCHGARMTGAGFGGCAVALVDRDRCGEFTLAVGEAFRRQMGLEAAIHVCRPSGGASLRSLA